MVRVPRWGTVTCPFRGAWRDRLGSGTVAVGRSEKSHSVRLELWECVVIPCLVDYLGTCGAIRRTHVIRCPLRSRSGSESKSCFMESAQGKRRGRGLGFCPRIAKRAAEICPSAREAKNPKYRTLCW